MKNMKHLTLGKELNFIKKKWQLFKFNKSHETTKKYFY